MSRDFVESINPATGEVIARHVLMDAAALNAAIDTAHAGWITWRDRPLPDRAATLAALGAALRDRADRFARLITAEMGKPIAQARAEVEKCAGLCDWYAANGPALLADEPLPVTDDGRAIVYWQPIGIVFAVMPWNFPIWQALRAAVPIMLAGNGFVLKHADNVQGCATLLAETAVAAGIPVGAFTNIAIAQEASIGVVGDPRIAAVTVTAGPAAGAAIAAEAGRHLKKSVLELGGVDPFIVLADADLDAAVAAAVTSRFANAGQVCIAAKRLIVEAPVLAAFTERFVAATRRLVIGDPMDEATFIGPLARPRGRDELHAHVVASIDAGARLLLGGEPLPGPGNFYAPTILADVTPTMAAGCNELFGPVAAIMTADDADHAIALANATEYGLSAALWSGDAVRADKLARRIEAGAVFVNGISASDPRVPIGGIKRSGYGRELSWFGVREFANAKLIWTR
ncbi:aldehyde dehydrogenase family protein [Sphingomonas mollis]|uniref:Aldehyde dehydrogenase family protein n=1 Tax=Sphingomonas mollis TaxID=2795726 RepID=A0ABS0XNU2_9SPHN|nr:aldehyde dehydrogenase family protein [Sphingomonas sp. BT553]MBJ6121455.1 aldehyde dehydrogenase family protein [Sphingomonas sp. BT553]